MISLYLIALNHNIFLLLNRLIAILNSRVLTFIIRIKCPEFQPYIHVSMFLIEILKRANMMPIKRFSILIEYHIFCYILEVPQTFDFFVEFIVFLFFF